MRFIFTPPKYLPFTIIEEIRVLISNNIIWIFVKLVFKYLFLNLIFHA